MANHVKRDATAPLRVFVTSWNVQSTASGVECFFQHVCDEMVCARHGVVFVCLQEDSWKSTHAQTLERILAKRCDNCSQYVVSSHSFMGVGATTLKTGALRGLRTIVCRRDDIEAVESARTTPLRSLQSLVTHNKGAIAVTLRISQDNTPADAFLEVTCVNTHLPHRSAPRKCGDAVGCGDLIEEQNAAFCFVHEWALSAAPNAAMIMAGDMNYRREDMTWSSDATARQKTHETQCALDACDVVALERTITLEDRLRIEMDWGRIPPYIEGPYNGGPLFMPTCKLSKHDTAASVDTAADSQTGVSTTTTTTTTTTPSVDDYKLGVNDHRTPSWCDRVLFQNTRHHRWTCHAYEAFVPQCDVSDHAAVAAALTLAPVHRFAWQTFAPPPPLSPPVSQ